MIIMNKYCKSKWSTINNSWRAARVIRSAKYKRLEELQQKLKK